jgi:hypothetical protein
MYTWHVWITDDAVPCSIVRTVTPVNVIGSKSSYTTSWTRTVVTLPRIFVMLLKLLWNPSEVRENSEITPAQKAEWDL